MCALSMDVEFGVPNRLLMTVAGAGTKNRHSFGTAVFCWRRLQVRALVRSIVGRRAADGRDAGMSESTSACIKKKTRLGAGFERYLRYRGANWVSLHQLGEQRRYFKRPLSA